MELPVVGWFIIDFRDDISFLIDALVQQFVVDFILVVI